MLVQRKKLENGTLEVREFIFAGNSLFTVRRESDKTRFTYRVIESKNKEVFFVRLLTSSDNDGGYAYLGFIRKSDRIFRTSSKSSITPEAPGYKLFLELFNAISRGTLTVDSTTYKVWHEGCCGRCGRTLTVPSSIESGYGPECVKLQAKRLTLQYA